ncbi:MAG: Ig domain-containing protein [Eubacteriales bacterium]
MKRVVGIVLAIILVFNSLITGSVSAASSAVGVAYQSHVQNTGWQTSVSDGQVAGTTGMDLRMEALKINLTNAPAGAGITYQSHVSNVGWQSPVSNGQITGTIAQSQQMEAIKITLVNMPGYSVQYQVHVAQIGWQSWVTDGQLAGTTGRSLKIEAIRIELVKISDNSGVDVQYQSQVQDIGWQTPVFDGQMAGTEGLSLRMEALRINLVNAPAGAGIQYSAHVSTIGWQNIVSDGQIAGTVAQSLQMEAIKITLVNMPGYSVQYQTHVSNVGWQPWAADGEIAGTTGRGLKIEAIRIRIVDNTLYSAGEIAVAAYENAPLTTLTEVSAAEGLKAAADTAAAAVGNATERAALEVRIADRAAVIASARAALEEAARQAGLQAAAETAVAAYENAPITTLSEITAAEGLKAEADTAAAAVGDATVRTTFEVRISNRAAAIASARTVLEEAAHQAALQAAAETAVAAYENAPITTLPEITAAEGLKAAADTAAAAVGDGTARSAFQVRISNRAAAIASAKAILKEVEALLAVNTAATGTMGAVITTYSTTLGLSSATMGDYGLLSPAGKDNVYTALAGKAFPSAAAVRTAFDIVVGTQIINEITVRAKMEAALRRYAGILGFDATAYSTYIASSTNALSFRAHITDALILVTFASAADVKAAFDSAVMAEAVHSIDIQVYNYMDRELRTYASILGLNLTDYDTLVNKNPIITGMVAEPFTTSAHIKEFFDSLVAQQKSLEALPMLDAFNSAPDAATMGNVIDTYSTLFKAADYNAYNNFIGAAAKAVIHTAMLTPVYTSNKDIQMAFVIGLVNTQYINYGKQVFANNIVFLGLATSTAANEFAALPYAEQTLITNAVFAARPIADQAGVVAAALNSTATESYIGTLLTLNSGILGIDLTAYNLLSTADTATVNQWLLAANMYSTADVQAAFNAAMFSLSNILAVGEASAASGTSTITYTLTTGTFDPTTGASAGNWILGGLDAADLGTITNVALSNGDTTATLTISGIVNSGFDYSAAPAQAALLSGFAAPAPVTVIVSVIIQAVSTATATTGASAITYSLTTGVFDPVTSTDPANWTLGGTDLGDLGSITGIALSNSDRTATIMITGIVGDNTKIYTVAPAQAAFAAGFAAPAESAVDVIADTLAVGSAIAVAGYNTVTYNLTTGTFDPVTGMDPANWTLGGTYSADLGAVASVVISNADKTAILTLTGLTYQFVYDYSVAPSQTAFTAGFAAPSAAIIMVYDNPIAVGTATATTGTSTITYALTTGIFDPVEGIAAGNWILGGADVNDLGTITNLALSNNDRTATITISGTVGANTQIYTVIPTQAIFFWMGYTSPLAPSTVNIITDTLAAGTAKATAGATTITYTLITGTFNAATAVDAANWTLGGALAAELGTITNIALSNGDTKATLTIDGVIWQGVTDYTAAPSQTAFAPGFAAPSPVFITVLNPQAAGGATAVTGTNTIIYDLTTGMFDSLYGADTANWILGGTNVSDLGTISSVAFPNGGLTAIITLTGTVGANTMNYTIAPADIMFTPYGYSAPALAAVVVTP